MSIVQWRLFIVSETRSVVKKFAGGGRELDMDGIVDGSIPGCFTLLQCRTVRIGSYKVVPKDRVLLSSVGIRIAVPAIEDGEHENYIYVADFY